MIQENKIFACSSGSALKDIGIIEFFEKARFINRNFL